jgi:hypothetical protein
MLNGPPLEIALVHLGSRPPRYLHLSAKQIRLITGREPVIVGPRVAGRYRSPKLDAFRKTEHLSALGLEGFWRYTCERFFVLEEHMRATGLSSCVHIESDNLIYAAPAAYAAWLRDTYGDGIAICPFQELFDTAAVMYVGSVGTLGALTEAMLELVAMPPADLLAKHGGDHPNEMRMLHVLRAAGLAGALPVTPEDAAASGAEHIFDPGSYGQFIDGWYWEPGVSYINDRHLLGAALADGRLRLAWDARRERPTVQGLGTEPRTLANLHIHSKNLEIWMTQAPAQAKEPAGFPSEATLRSRTRRGAQRALASAARVWRLVSRRTS